MRATITPKLISECMAIARDMAPKDTGNLAFIGMRTILIPGGFQIIYLENIAPYFHYLNDGTERFSGHKGFIEATEIAIALHIDAVENGTPYSFQDTWNRLAKQGKDNPARQQRFLKMTTIREGK